MSNSKKNWGTEVTPKSEWVDVVAAENGTKTYRTRGGKRIIGLCMVLNNQQGQEVTFPIKGSVVLNENPKRTEYNVWTLAGKHGLFGDSKFDIVEVK